MFADQQRIPYDWLDNNDQADGLDPTPMVDFPEIPAELPGVLIDRDPPSPDDHIATNHNEPDWSQSPDDCIATNQDEPDWSQLANKAVHNADLDVADVLPPPPRVIEIDDEDEYAAFPLPLPLVIPKVEPDLAVPNIEHTPTAPSPLTPP